MTRTVFSLLVYASLVCAQNWQWEQYQGTFWHQASDEIPWLGATIDDGTLSGYLVSGDFNGNGRDEVMGGDIALSRYETTTENQLDHWTHNLNTSPFYYPDERQLFMQALNLDEDAQDEMIVYSKQFASPYTPHVRAYDPDNSTFPRFTERPDLIESLAFPGFPSPCILGNFDGDSLLDGFAPTQFGWQHFERTGNTWALLDTFHALPAPTDYTSLLAADINSDGDMEIGVYEPGFQCDCLLWTIADYENGAIEVDANFGQTLIVPGDYDGDGNTESFFEGFELSLPSSLVRLSSGDPFTAIELVNRIEANSPVVFSVNNGENNYVYGYYNGEHDSWTMIPAGYKLLWTDSMWILASDSGGFGQVLEGNTADINGDSQREYIYRMRVLDPESGGTKEVWSMASGNFSTFYDNEDTLFTMPRIGDVEGDGVGELVTRVASGAPTGLYFYELERIGGEVIAHHKPELSEDLPTNITEFTLADIDNDGHAELFINTGYWRSFFWRNGRWTEYTGILPTGIGLNLYFADFDGDGDLDVFSQNGVWLSLTPSPVEENPDILHPSSFILQVFPNPFNAETTLQFDLPQSGLATLKIFDVLGREVETLLDENMTAGTHVLHYNAAQLSSGVYFAKLESSRESITHKLLLLK